MHKEPLAQEKMGMAGIASQGQGIDLDLLRGKNAKAFIYWIEFLHHRKMGQKIWLKRRREEILMSARYARE